MPEVLASRISNPEFSLPSFIPQFKNSAHVLVHCLHADIAKQAFVMTA